MFQSRTTWRGYRTVATPRWDVRSVRTLYCYVADKEIGHGFKIESSSSTAEPGSEASYTGGDTEVLGQICALKCVGSRTDRG